MTRKKVSGNVSIFTLVDIRMLLRDTANHSIFVHLVPGAIEYGKQLSENRNAERYHRDHSARLKAARGNYVRIQFREVVRDDDRWEIR